MSAVSESMNRRMTLGLLASRYGFDLDPTSAAEVTITSIADNVESVRPGALFVPSADVDVHQLSQAQEQGAYGAIVPHALRGQTDDIQIPLIYAEPTMGQLGKLVSDMAGNPSDVIGRVRHHGEEQGDRGIRSEEPRGFPAHVGQPRRRDQLVRFTVIGTLPQSGISSVGHRCATYHGGVRRRRRSRCDPRVG